MGKRKGNSNKSAVTLAKRKMLRRARGSADIVLESIQDIPFHKLATAVFLICQDLEAEQFVHQYEGQIELAGANPTRFREEINTFYEGMAEKIRRESLYQDFFEFIGAFSKLRITQTDDPQKAKVLDAYLTMLLQQMEYLRPSKYDYSVVVCGLTTDDQVMTMPDYFPEFDDIVDEIKEWRLDWIKRNGVPPSSIPTEQYITNYCARYGYKANGISGYNRLAEIDKLFSSTHSAMAQYINEYTYDILPDVAHVYNTNAGPFFSIQLKHYISEDLVSMLKKRAKTIPANGVTVVFSYPGNTKFKLFERVLVKEILYADRVIMLFRVWTSEGEFSGYYDTRTGFLFSPFSHTNYPQLADQFKTFILYLYAGVVARNGPEMLQHMCEFIWFEDDQILANDYSVEVYNHAGKLINTYKRDGGTAVGHGSVAKRADADAYIMEVKPVQGFVRKVGMGRCPSEEAVARGIALGYDLAPDETYVQGFFRATYKIKEKDTTP